MTEKEITGIYETLRHYHKEYLQEYGVKLPALQRQDGTFNRNALVLVYLAQGYPETKIVSANCNNKLDTPW